MLLLMTPYEGPGQGRCGPNRRGEHEAAATDTGTRFIPVRYGRAMIDVPCPARHGGVIQASEHTVRVRSVIVLMTEKNSVNGTSGQSASDLIDVRIKELGDWRGRTLSRLRRVIKQADPDVVEEWKWRGVPVWSHDGIICTGEVYKDVVKATFAKGASLDEAALTALVRAAVALNTSTRRRRS
jgi:hypothetical protein